jgi:hypothetical protein
MAAAQIFAQRRAFSDLSHDDAGRDSGHLSSNVATF